MGIWTFALLLLIPSDLLPADGPWARLSHNSWVFHRPSPGQGAILTRLLAPGELDTREAPQRCCSTATSIFHESDSEIRVGKAGTRV